MVTAVLLLFFSLDLQSLRAEGARLENERRWDEAAVLYRDALHQAYGPPDRLWILSSLAEVSFELSDYRQARRWLREAGSVIEALPSQAPERGWLANNWGTLLLVEGNLTAAEKQLELAVSHAGSAAARIAALHNLASVEMQTGRLKTARAHEEEVLAAWRAEFGERSRHVQRAWIGLSTIAGLSGEWKEAERCALEAMNAGESADALANYAVILEKLKRGREAKAVRKRIETSAFAPVVDVKALEAGGPRAQAH